MDWTDRHCRYFFRQMTQEAMLYTEMVVADAIIYGDKDFFLKFDKIEHPVGLQIAGSDPIRLSEAAKLGEEYGYDEINLNLGCPSRKDQEGNFGACMMKDLDLVEKCLSKIKESVKVPVTVKCRIGLDDDDPYQVLPNFIERIKKIDIDTFIIHARKAILNGLDPKKNREVPPLDYDIVRLLKRKWPELNFILNGGLSSISDAKREISSGRTDLDGVMLGRGAVGQPWIFRELAGKAKMTVQEKWNVMERHVHLAYEFYGMKMGLKMMRKHIKAYLINFDCGDLIPKAMSIDEPSELTDFLGQRELEDRLEHSY